MQNKKSETITENIFRGFYGSNAFIEKSAIPSEYGFSSKNRTNLQGYPDFFKDKGDYIIIVEAKADNHDDAEEEIKFYMLNNKVNSDIIGIAIAGQTHESIDVSYFVKRNGDNKIETLNKISGLQSLDAVNREYLLWKYGESISTEALVAVLEKLNKRFNNENKIRDTDRSLFFSGLMIALTDANFRNTYKNMQPLSSEEKVGGMVANESHNINEAILEAIEKQLDGKINNLSKEFSWKDKFSFIKTVDYPLLEYKSIISEIEEKIFKPFLNSEKQDILGRAYKIFLKRAGKVDNKNIILTPDHIKRLMVKLARLSKDDIVLDTCTGSGGFLMEAMETMTEQARGDTEKIKSIKERQLIGFEIDSVLFALACSNMFLHGDGRTNLIYGNSLLNDDNGNVKGKKEKALLDSIKKLKPSKVIINPPYEKNNAIKFTKQAIDFLEPNGKLVIIMPTPTLTQNQGKLTNKILQEAKLDFVIKMPFNLFAEQKRTVNTAIFGFTKTPHHQDDETLFYRLDDDGFVSIQHKGRIDKNGKWSTIESDIISCISNARENVGICEKKKIYENGILNCNGFQNGDKSNHEMISVAEIFDIVKGSLASEQSDDNGEYDFITASEEWKKHSSYTYDDEAIVIATHAAGSLGRAHYVNGKFIASNLCCVLKRKQAPDNLHRINLRFYAYYFNCIKKRLAADLADGTSKLTIDPDLLKKYYIDYIPYADQEKFVSEYLIPLDIAASQLQGRKISTEKEFTTKFL